MNEQPRALRKRTLIGARLLIGKTGTLDCTVRNISDTGELVFATPTINVANELDADDAMRRVRDGKKKGRGRRTLNLNPSRVYWSGLPKDAPAPGACQSASKLSTPDRSKCIERLAAWMRGLSGPKARPIG